MTAQTPKILIVDLLGLAADAQGRPDHSAARDHILARGAEFHEGSARGRSLAAGKAHFFYMPHLANPEDLIAEAGDGLYDAVIAAATFLPKETRFDLGGVRIGAGTGNMGSASWGGGEGKGGRAPLMNTPGMNARATAQMVMKAILARRPDLPVDEMHQMVLAGRFDTGRNLADFPTAKLEGQTMAVFGYGNIGREVAKLARSFGMITTIYARPRHRKWIEAEGFLWAETPQAAARGADVLSVHLGLGPKSDEGFANAGLIGDDILQSLAPGALLINYDRGELVEIAALERALESGQIAHAAIDADLFVDPHTGALSGPMQPYLALGEKYADRLCLLPHAAADTDHPSRVAGARQAIDQILDVIEKKEVTNLKGDLPEGYQTKGAHLPLGIGGLDAQALGALGPKMPTLSQNLDDLQQALRLLEEKGPAQTGEALMLAANNLAKKMRDLGLEGPWRQE